MVEEHVNLQTIQKGGNTMDQVFFYVKLATVLLVSYVVMPYAWALWMAFASPFIDANKSKTVVIFEKIFVAVLLAVTVWQGESLLVKAVNHMLRDGWTSLDNTFVECLGKQAAFMGKCEIQPKSVSKPNQTNNPAPTEAPILNLAPASTQTPSPYSSGRNEPPPGHATALPGQPSDYQPSQLPNLPRIDPISSGGGGGSCQSKACPSGRAGPSGCLNGDGQHTCGPDGQWTRNLDITAVTCRCVP